MIILLLCLVYSHVVTFVFVA